MIWIDEKGHKLKIIDEVIEIFLKYRQVNNTTKEAGGILIGRYLKQGNDAVIDCITEPSFYDQRKRNFFHRSSKIHNEFAQEMWDTSNGTENYLGEWHTHPERDPVPSQCDLNSWNQHMVRLDKDLGFTFFIIVGIKRIEVWKGELNTCRIVKMTRVI